MARPDYSGPDGPVEYRNRRGQSKWQPRLANGERLYFYDWLSSGKWEAEAIGFSLNSEPILTTHRRAVRRAEQEQRRRDRQYLEVRMIDPNLPDGSE